MRNAKCGMNDELPTSFRNPRSAIRISSDHVAAGGRQHADDLSGGAPDDFCQRRMDINDVDQGLDVVAPFHHGKHSME